MFSLTVENIMILVSDREAFSANLFFLFLTSLFVFFYVGMCSPYILICFPLFVEELSVLISNIRMLYKWLYKTILPE